LNIIPSEAVLADERKFGQGVIARWQLNSRGLLVGNKAC